MDLNLIGLLGGLLGAFPGGQGLLGADDGGCLAEGGLGQVLAVTLLQHHRLDLVERGAGTGGHRRLLERLG